MCDYYNDIHYTWKNKWHQKYESIWGLWEKFKYINIPSNTHSKLISLRYSSTIYNFDNNLMCYRKGRINKDSPVYKWESGIPLLNKFIYPEYLFYKNIRYCPICMKYGYHSFLHQIKTIDTCFLHNCQLIDRCNCDNEYSIGHKSEKFEAFQCVNCNATIIEIPLAIDGICNDWNISINEGSVNNDNEDIKCIYYLDPNISLSNSIKDFTESQKSKINKLLFKKTAGECSPLLSVNSKDSEYPIKNYHKKILINLHNKYGFEYCENQYRYIKRWISYDNYNNVDYEVIAYFYLINDLLLKRYVDKIYPNNYGITGAEYDSEWNDFLQIASNWNSLDKGRAEWRHNIGNRDNKVFNYIYENLILSRYQDILNYIKKNPTDSYKICDLLVPYTESFYPTYLIIEYENSDVEIY